MSSPQRERYDDIVVGAGTAGLTSASLLARMGRSVLVVDSAPAPGGALRRFSRGGAWFDTGFHFTGSVLKGELFDHLLDVLGVRDEVTILPYDSVKGHRFKFTKQGVEFDVPFGLDQACTNWQKLFPKERGSIAWYFDALRSITRRTMGMEIGQPLTSFGMLDEDFITLRSVLDEQFSDPLLKGLISAFSMCYGSPPSSVSFAAHARVAYGFHQSGGMVKGGGDRLAAALTQAAVREGAEICCQCGLKAFSKIEGKSPREAILSDGSCVSFERCLLTIDPAMILGLLDPVHPTPAFRERVQAYDPSIGFFAAYGVLDADTVPSGFGHAVYSEFPDTDFDQMMDPAWDGERPQVVIEVPGDKASGVPPSVSALELSFVQDVEPWKDSSLRHRPAGYLAYKRERFEAIQQRLSRTRSYGKDVKWLDAASMLTFRDYMHSPSGSAYGIMQKVGQYGLFGRLPGRNLYAAGQSALLPGVLGSMMSGLFAVRQMVSSDVFDKKVFGT